MSKSLNIVELIETNPITCLSNTYQNKLLNKIKEKFSDNEQQIFVASFYCYLNYKDEFIIDLDNIWKWLGFNQKFNAKRLLENLFTINKDYKVLLLFTEEQKKPHFAPQVGGAKTDTRGGHNKETIMLNIIKNIYKYNHLNTII